MQHTLDTKFESLNTAVEAATQRKTNVLGKMNTLVGRCDETRKNAEAEEHLDGDGRWAEVIIEDKSNDFYVESYKQMHIQLMTAMAEEKLAFAEFDHFLSGMNFDVAPTDYEPLSAFAVRAGKILIDTVVGQA